MLRETLLAVSLMVVLVTVPGFSLASTTPTWSYSVVDTQVPQGALLVVSVMGPPNGTFTLSLNPLPFNSSNAIFTELYSLPNSTSLPNGTASGEVRLNTSLFAIQGYRLTLSQSDGTPIGLPTTLSIVVPEDTALVNQVSQLQFDLEVNATRLAGLLYLRDEVKGWAEFAVGVSLGTFAIETYLILATRTAAQERRMVAKINDVGHRLIWQKRGIEHTGSWTVTQPAGEIDPRAIFIAARPQCEVCEMPQKWQAVADHLTVVHRIPADGVSAAIVSSPDATTRVRTSMRAQRDSEGPTYRGRSKAAKASGSGAGTFVDLSGIVDGEKEN